MNFPISLVEHNKIRADDRLKIELLESQLSDLTEELSLYKGNQSNVILKLEAQLKDKNNQIRVLTKQLELRPVRPPPGQPTELGRKRMEILSKMKECGNDPHPHTTRYKTLQKELNELNQQINLLNPDVDHIWLRSDDIDWGCGQMRTGTNK